MPSPDVLDFATLLAPIPGDAPAGVDPRQDVSAGSPWFRLKAARSRASAAERTAAGAAEADATQSLTIWREIQTLGLALLKERAKDLQVCASLIESLVRTHGYAGLRDGIRLARELSEQYWDALFPTPDEDGVATRVAPLLGLNGDESEGTLIGPLARVPITAAGGDVSFATWQWKKANTPYQGNATDDSYEEKRQQHEAAVTQLKTEIENAVRATPTDWYVALVDDLNAALAETAKLSDVLDSKCGHDAPSTGAIRGALQAALEVILVVAKERLPAAAIPADAAAAASGATAGGGGAAPGGGPLQTRAAAFAQLTQVADFFRRTEPHSPLSYMVDEAVRYGGLTLPELLTELIPDETARKALFLRTGIKPSAS